MQSSLYWLPIIIAMETEVRISLGTNSSMFANCSSFGDVREVRCSVLGLNVVFGDVRSSVLMFGEHHEHLGVIQHPFFAYFI